MQGKRTDRVGHLLQMELSRIVLHKIKDPRLGFVTITKVDVTPDIRSACVLYSVMGDEEAKKNTQLVLEKSAGFLQREIGSILNLRNTPKLIFKRDDAYDHRVEIDAILDSIKKDDAEDSEEGSVEKDID